MITSLLDIYYFISTTITTINQSYYIKRILYIYSIIIMILRLWFKWFCRLKSMPVAIGLRGPMLSSECISLYQLGPSKVTPPVDNTWPSTKKGPEQQETYHKRHKRTSRKFSSFKDST